MKKIFLSVLFVAVATFGFSQAKLEVGLKGGVNLASLKSSDVDGDNLTAFHGGAYALIKISKIGIQPEILFSKRGNENIDLSYMDIPIMLKYYIAAGFNLQVGPQFGILTKVEGKGVEKNFFEDSDLSAAFGVGIDLPMGLSITGRYILGLKDINKNIPNVTDEIKNNTFQFSVGYRLFKVGN